jgi:uncharacterized small protein (DUF1192 family)
MNDREIASILRSTYDPDQFDVADAKRDVSRLESEVTRLTAEVERLKAERDAAVEDWEHAAGNSRAKESCNACQNLGRNNVGEMYCKAKVCKPKWRGGTVKTD